MQQSSSLMEKSSKSNLTMMCDYCFFFFFLFFSFLDFSEIFPTLANSHFLIQYRSPITVYSFFNGILSFYIRNPTSAIHTIRVVLDKEKEKEKENSDEIGLSSVVTVSTESSVEFSLSISHVKGNFSLFFFLFQQHNPRWTTSRASSPHCPSQTLSFQS